VWSDDAQPAGFPDVITASIQDPNKQVNGVLKGRADLASPTEFGGRPPQQLRTLRTQYAAQLHVDQLEEVSYLFLNTHREPFSDLRARRALDWAIDRGQLTALAGGRSLAEPTCQILPPGVPGYRPYCPYTLKTAAGGVWSAPNYAQAARLVAMSHTGGRRVVIGTFQFQTYLARPLIATLARLGYRPVLRNLPSTGTTYTGFDGVLQGWLKDFAAASDFIDPLFTCQGSVNPTRFCDPAIDAQVRRAATAQLSDPVTADAAWARTDRGLVDKAAAIPLFTYQAATLLSKRVGNYQFNPQWGPLLDQLWVR
jgi:peptide/nickel transport system substrate-binding protein